MTKGDTHRWEIQEGWRLDSTMQVGNGILRIVVSQDGKWIVSGYQGGKAIVWNATTHGKALEFTEHRDEVAAVDSISQPTLPKLLL